jgi:hypothetical protein
LGGTAISGAWAPNRCIGCGPEPERRLHAISTYLEAGFDHIHKSEPTPDGTGFIESPAQEIEHRITL